MLDSPDSLQFSFFVAALLVIGCQVFIGWRIGVTRQLFNLLGLVCSYAVAIWGGNLAAPIFEPFGYPRMVVSLVAGAALGMIVFIAISTLGAILFRKTAQQNVGVVRVAYGAAGSVIGVIFGLVTVWMAVIAIRLLGTLAEAEIAMDVAEEAMHHRPHAGTVARGVAQMKHSLEQGRTGTVVRFVDPLPLHVYALVAKMGRMMSDPDSMSRFMTYPGARKISENPKVAALRHDPGVIHDIRSKNFLALLKNKQVVRVVDDPEVVQLVKNFEFEKALDYALED